MSNPFELRLEMLKIAKEYLDRQFDFSRESFHSTWEITVSAAEKLGKAMPEMPELPKMYGVDEIAKIAETLNKFVSGGSK